MLPSAYIHFARQAKAQVILNAYGLAGTIKKQVLNNKNIANNHTS